jgi:hypothetical protein
LITAETNIGFLPVFSGAFFLTFTLGAGVSIYSLAGVRILLAREKNWKLISLLLFPLVLSLLMLAIDGSHPLFFLFFFCVPLITVYIAIKIYGSKKNKWTAESISLSFEHISGRQEKQSFKELLAGWVRETAKGPYLFIPLLLFLAVFWSFQNTTSFFSNFRDLFLLSNTPGNMVNNFYYSHGMALAEAIRPFEKKPYKTYSFVSEPGFELKENIQNEFRRHGLLHLENPCICDFAIKVDGDEIHAYHENRLLIKSNLGSFFSKSDNFFDKLNKLDKNKYLRLLIHCSILFALPLLFYELLQILINCFSFFLPFEKEKGAFFSLFISLTVITIFLASCYYPLNQEKQNRGIRKKKFNEIVKFKNSKEPGKRIILCKYLTSKDSPDATEVLLSLLADPHLNVSCQAAHALGKQGNPEVLLELKNIVTGSEEWYRQWYAYKAMKNLGWNQ